MRDELEYIHMASPARLSEMLENSRSDLFSPEFRELLTESAKRLRSLMRALKPDDEEIKGLEPVEELYKKRICQDVWFSVRTTNHLKALEIETIGELMQYNPKSFLRLRNFGKKSMLELTEFAYDNGLTFGDKDIIEKIRSITERYRR